MMDVLFKYCVKVLWLNQKEDSSPVSFFVHTRTSLFSGVKGSSSILPEDKRVIVFSISTVSFISSSQFSMLSKISNVTIRVTIHIGPKVGKKNILAISISILLILSTIRSCLWIKHSYNSSMFSSELIFQYKPVSFCTVFFLLSFNHWCLSNTKQYVCL